MTDSNEQNQGQQTVGNAGGIAGVTKIPGAVITDVSKDAQAVAGQAKADERVAANWLNAQVAAAKAREQKVLAAVNGEKTWAERHPWTVTGIIAGLAVLIVVMALKSCA